MMASPLVKCSLVSLVVILFSVGCFSKADSTTLFFAKLDAKRLEVSNRIEAIPIPSDAPLLEQIHLLGMRQEISWDYVHWLESLEIPATPIELTYLVRELIESGYQYGIYLQGLKLAAATANLSALHSLEGARRIAESTNINLVWAELKLRQQLGIPIPKPQS